MASRLHVVVIFLACASFVSASTQTAGNTFVLRFSLCGRSHASFIMFRHAVTLGI